MYATAVTKTQKIWGAYLEAIMKVHYCFFLTWLESNYDLFLCSSHDSLLIKVKKM